MSETLLPHNLFFIYIIQIHIKLLSLLHTILSKYIKPHDLMLYLLSACSFSPLHPSHYILISKTTFCYYLHPISLLSKLQICLLFTHTHTHTLYRLPFSYTFSCKIPLHASNISFHVASFPSIATLTTSFHHSLLGFFFPNLKDSQISLRLSKAVYFHPLPYF